MLLACRLAGLSALEAHYVGVVALIWPVGTSRNLSSRRTGPVSGRLRPPWAMGLAIFLPLPLPTPPTSTRYFVGFHSRASRCASAICAGVILAATLSRFFAATPAPCAAAKLYHIWART